MTIYEGTQRVSSPMGTRVLNGKTENHRGIDVVKGHGSKQRATIAGIVEWVSTGYNYGRGVNVIIKQELNGQVCRVRHQHCDQILVKEGQLVIPTTFVSTEGATGNVTGSHDHYEVVTGGTLNRSTGEIIGGSVRNPSDWLGIANAVGTYPQNDIVYNVFGHSFTEPGTQPGGDDVAKLCIIQPFSTTPSSALLNEGNIVVKQPDGTFKVYNPKGDARRARQWDASNMSEVFDDLSNDMLDGEILVVRE